MTSISFSATQVDLAKSGDERAGGDRRVLCGWNYLVAWLLIVLAVMLSPSIVPVSSTCCPAWLAIVFDF